MERERKKEWDGKKNDVSVRNLIAKRWDQIIVFQRSYEFLVFGTIKNEKQYSEYYTPPPPVQEYTLIKYWRLEYKYCNPKQRP